MMVSQDLHLSHTLTHNMSSRYPCTLIKTVINSNQRQDQVGTVNRSRNFFLSLRSTCEIFVVKTNRILSYEEVSTPRCVRRVLPTPAVIASIVTSDWYFYLHKHTHVPAFAYSCERGGFSGI